MSRLDFCIYELVDNCYDWKNDNCDGCNIFKAYCEGERRAKNSIVRCKDCQYCKDYGRHRALECTNLSIDMDIHPMDYCSRAKMKGGAE